MSNDPLEVTPSGAALGAVVRGIDLSSPLPQPMQDRLHALWMTHQVLVFPGQRISDEQHISFGRLFGDLEVHPSLAHRSSANAEIYRVSNVDEAGELIPVQDTSWQYLSQSWRWHTDSSFREVPSLGSILHGIRTTREGGRTAFANMVAVFDALSPAMRSTIDGLEVVHDHDHILGLAPGLVGRADRGTYDELPPVRHPLVRRHPVTGRRSLFLSPHTMSGVAGMSAESGRALLDELIEFATDERFVYRHEWSDDDVLMWDNRCTMHSVEPFDSTRVRRIMHRVTLVGDGRPVAAPAS